MKFSAAFLSLLLILLCGCSKQKQLSQLLSTADHVVATNRNMAFSCTVSGEEVRNLAKAIASAGRPYGLKKLDSRNAFVWHLDFYAGTNSLAMMHLFKNGFIELEDVGYIDGTGVGEAFYKKLEEKSLKKTE